MAQILTMQSSKLVVGLDVLPQLLHSGQAYINGPLTIGNPAIPPVASVNVNLPNPSLGALIPVNNAIGVNIIAPTIGFNVVAPVNNITGVLNLIGIDNTTGVKTIVGLQAETGLKTTNGADIGNGLKINNAKEITIASMTVAGVCKAVSFVGSGAGLTGVKMASAFDIAHWKKKNTRIRHVIAEGPEAGIYVRGKVKGNVIDLPEYWDGLVDPETITVTLTAFGRAQNLYVKEIQYGRRVIIANEDGSMPDCHYEVWVARWLDPRDHSKKLHVTYEGKTPDDYPGDSRDFLVGGWDYDRREQQWYPDSSDGGTGSIDIHSKG